MIPKNDLFGHTFTPSISQEMCDWEAELAMHPRFLRLTKENRSLFFTLLNKEQDLDTYASSPSYYALTGRKGLWLYQNENGYVPVCWHPNVDGQILVFPPRGIENKLIMQRLLTEMPEPPRGIRLARLSEEGLSSVWFSKAIRLTGRNVRLVPVQETVLDWRFPVHILSTKIVASLEGNHFLRTRNYVKHLKQRNVQIEPLTRWHTTRVMDFAFRWANKRTDNVNELIELVAPYQETFSLLDDEALHLGGLVIKIDGQIQAVTMWEKPNTKTGIANALVNICNTSFKGLSDFAMKVTAEALFSQEVLYINYGGSETEGLDNFKKKFLPAFSIPLRSIEAVIEGEDAILKSLLAIQKNCLKNRQRQTASA